MQYTNAHLQSNNRNLQVINVNEEIRQIIRVGIDNRRVISGEGPDAGNCLEREIDNLYSLQKAFNVAYSQDINSGSIISGFPMMQLDADISCIIYMQ